MSGSKIAEMQDSSHHDHEHSVIATTGVPSTKIRLVAYIDQINNGKRNHVSPGTRILWMVTMKFRPVRMDENPVMKMPATAQPPHRNC